MLEPHTLVRVQLWLCVCVGGGVTLAVRWFNQRHDHTGGFLSVSSTLSFYCEGVAVCTAASDGHCGTSACPSDQTQLSGQPFQSSGVKSDSPAPSGLWLALAQWGCWERGARPASGLCSSVRRRVLMKVLIPSAAAARIDWWQQLPQRSIHMLVLTRQTRQALMSWLAEVCPLSSWTRVWERQPGGCKHCRTVQAHTAVGLSGSDSLCCTRTRRIWWFCSGCLLLDRDLSSVPLNARCS